MNITQDFYWTTVKYLRPIGIKIKQILGNLSKELLISHLISSNPVAASLHLPVPEYCWDTLNGAYLQLQSFLFWQGSSSQVTHKELLCCSGDDRKPWTLFCELPLRTRPPKHERKQLGGEKMMKRERTKDRQASCFWRGGRSHVNNVNQHLLSASSCARWRHRG